MTIRQLATSQRSYMREFEAAVLRRRRDLKKLMAKQMSARLASKKPNNAKTKEAARLKMKVVNSIHRSIYNSVMRNSCPRWIKDPKNGQWNSGRKKGSRCEARKK